MLRRGKIMRDSELIKEALEARKMAYTPYSHFNVGAALLTKDGRVYRGCNIENASYTPSNCAERTAFFKAVSDGIMDFSAIAIVGGPAKTGSHSICSPCGVCRQVMMEFCDPKTFKIILGTDESDFKVYTLEQMLPLGFGPENLEADMEA
jgi:cytidine deaminase